jgi:hypothetical protein
LPHRRRRVVERFRRPAQPHVDAIGRSEPVPADNVVASLMSAAGEWATSMGADPNRLVILPLGDSRKRKLGTVGARDAGLSNAALTHFLDIRTAYPPEFTMQWAKSPKREVIADYEQHGGDRRLLFLVLWQLQLPEEADAPYPARVIRALRRSYEALEAALRSAPLRKGRSITRDANLRFMIRSQKDGTKAVLVYAQELADRQRRRGRPAGVTRKTLFTAVLAAEFERVYGRPQMRAIGILLGTNETHVRRLVDHASHADIEANLRFLRAQPAP